MTVFAALLRAINVGGTSKLAMSELRQLCADAGFVDAQTYIQSGNVVFETDLPEQEVRAMLEERLAARMGKPVGVSVRTAEELSAARARVPFENAAPNQVLIVFLNEAPDQAALHDVTVPGREQLQLVGRELFVHYPDGIGRSKLKVPFARAGTGRNLNTVDRLLEMMVARRAGDGSATGRMTKADRRKRESSHDDRSVLPKQTPRSSAKRPRTGSRRSR
jgi:uncharacterized protein (DUF1697 family)